MAVVVVIRSRQRPDDGAVIHLDAYAQALRFARDWQRRHPIDRVTIFTEQLESLIAIDSDQPGLAQSGSAASGTLS
jgi:hypothetical protein